MTIEACASLHSEDTPRIVEHKLRSIYNADFSADVARVIPESGETVEELRERLRQQSVTALDLDGFTSILVNLSCIAWRRGRAALAEIVDDLAEDSFAQAGVRQVAQGVPFDELVKALEARIPPALEAYGVRYHLFIAGITAIQVGRTGADLNAAMDANWARGRTMKWFPQYGPSAQAS